MISFPSWFINFRVNNIDTRKNLINTLKKKTKKNRKIKKNVKVKIIKIF